MYIAKSNSEDISNPVYKLTTDSLQTGVN